MNGEKAFEYLSKLTSQERKKVFCMGFYGKDDVTNALGWFRDECKPDKAQKEAIDEKLNDEEWQMDVLESVTFDHEDCDPVLNYLNGEVEQLMDEVWESKQEED